jgi:hypothetical protein
MQTWYSGKLLSGPLPYSVGSRRRVQLVYSPGDPVYPTPFYPPTKYNEKIECRCLLALSMQGVRAQSGRGEEGAKQSAWYRCTGTDVPARPMDRDQSGVAIVL